MIWCISFAERLRMAVYVCVSPTTHTHPSRHTHAHRHIVLRKRKRQELKGAVSVFKVRGGYMR